jgi:hypothetical protein
MFVTLPQAKIDLPPELKDERESLWRMVECTAHGFFVVVMTFSRDDADVRRTAFVCWDSDIVHLVESPKIRATLHSLHHIVSPKKPGAPPISFREVREVWRGVDRNADDCEVIIFKTTDGSEFCGLEAIPVPPSVQQLARIASVGAPRTPQPRPQ